VQSESEFVALTDRILGAVGAAIDAGGEDLDWSVNDGVLTIECPDGSRLSSSTSPAQRAVGTAEWADFTGSTAAAGVIRGAARSWRPRCPGFVAPGRRRVDFGVLVA
jgi:hypothetical protein